MSTHQSELPDAKTPSLRLGVLQLCCILSHHPSRQASSSPRGVLPLGFSLAHPPDPHGPDRRPPPPPNPPRPPGGPPPRGPTPPRGPPPPPRAPPPPRGPTAPKAGPPPRPTAKP